VLEASSSNFKVYVKGQKHSSADCQLWMLDGNEGYLKNKCTNKFLANQGGSGCSDGNELVVEAKATDYSNKPRQLWQFLPGGEIVNKKCGPREGSLAVSSVEDDSITKIEKPEITPVRFVNPETGMVLGTMNNNGIRIQNPVEEGQEQEFFIQSAHQGTFVILSRAVSGKSIQVNDDCDHILLDVSDPADPKTQWKIKGGKIESKSCEGKMIELSSTYNNGYLSPTPNQENLWSQQFSTRSSSTRLLTVGSKGQQWKAVYKEGNYDYALIPDFPKMNDKETSKSGMRACDESRDLLLGHTTSLGRLKSIVDAGVMPGTCCMDVATNSNYFGYRYDPKLKTKTDVSMQCQNVGPWHLGVSKEACENAGGSWHRTPCSTLQTTIHDRPSRFNLNAGQSGTCQDNMNKLITSYVSASTEHANYTLQFEESKMGCFNFCRSLPDYSLQIGMNSDDASSCTCVYNDGQVPAKALLPEYANRSPPKFTLKSGKFALGLSKSDCDSDRISLGLQLFASSTRQQFQLSLNNEIVSVACPSKVLTLDGVCGTETGLSAVDASSQLTTTQQWTIDATYGTIANVACPTFKISAVSTSGGKSSVISSFFMLENLKTHLSMGLSGDGTSCRAGEKIQLQKTEYGDPGQQFYLDNEKK
jgi:hypothetical protein